MDEDQLWDAIEAVVSAINLRNGTPKHSSRVATMSVALATDLGFEKDVIDEIRLGALLHDIGQLLFTDEMIHDIDRKLTDSEREMIRNHPIVGAQMIEDYSKLQCVQPFILHHQENLDGSGYPFRISHDAILPKIQVVAIVDVYEALRNSRYYLHRDGLTHEEALQKMALYRGRHWSVEVFDAFVKCSATWKI